MSMQVDKSGFPTFWRMFASLVTRLMTQNVTGKVTLSLHNGVIKGLEVDRVYLSADELAKYPPV